MHMKRGATRQNSEETNTSEAWFRNPILDLQTPRSTVDRGARKGTRARVDGNKITYFGRWNDASGISQHCQTGRPGCNHALTDFILSYEAIWVGAC